MRRLLIITALLMLGGTGVAAADSGTASTMLTPNKVSAPSTLAVVIAPPSGFSTLPTSISLVLQPGFASSAKSVPVLCTASQSSSGCPTASQIGTGTVGVSFLGQPYSVPITLYLGDPLQAGDIASVYLSGSLQGVSLTVSGRLFVPHQGGLELLLSSFPSEPVALTSLAMSAHATRTATTTVIKTVTKFVYKGKGKHRHKHRVKKKVKKKVTIVYSVITNPSTCMGAWTGTATLTYSSGSSAIPLSAACTS